MSIKTLVGYTDQLPIETFFTNARFIPRGKQDCAPTGIEREGHAPDAVSGVEAQFLHVRMLRPIERVHPWTAKRGTKFFEQARTGQNFVVHSFGKFVKLRLKFIAYLYVPFQLY